MPPRLLLIACLSLAVSTSASAHTSVGGGGTDDPNADCLRWEVVPVAPADGAVRDGSTDGAADAGGTDAGTSGPTVLVCVEHATMFGCACALRRPGGPDREAAVVLGTVALAALVAGARRARRANRRGGRR
jgi:hypothetical protein